MTLKKRFSPACWLSFQLWLNRGFAYVLLALLFCLLPGESFSPASLNFRLGRLTSGRQFNFIVWNGQALARKMAFGLLAPQRWMDEEQRAQWVLAYLDTLEQTYRLSQQIADAYTNPELSEPEQATAEIRQERARLRAWLDARAPLTEAILGEQVASVLQSTGMGTLGQLWPSVSGTFTPLPTLLILSPRAVIRSDYQITLQADMTAADMTELERSIELALPDYSAYITPIGGLSAYPAMVLEFPALDWLLEVMAHEWTHHYLSVYPLGIHYSTYGETRAINETSAELVGTWVGQMAIERFYAPYLGREKALPQPLRRSATPKNGASAPPRFDFYAEMHRTRVAVDRLLAEGRIEDAELYMELKRRYLVAQGYALRRLNQAYFAFHGAYAGQPDGAAGEDPIGPAVRRLWARTGNPTTFLHQVRRLTHLAELP